MELEQLCTVEKELHKNNFHTSPWVGLPKKWLSGFLSFSQIISSLLPITGKQNENKKKQKPKNQQQQQQKAI